jgi:phosphoribosylformylglycinamidine synthase
MLADASWVFSQYDHMLFLNTVEGPGGDATVLRLKHPTTGRDTGRGLALTTDGNHRWCALDPRQGAARVVSESILNLACVGARPIALVNCLNFGNPEHPSVMWQLSETIDGMSDACRAFGVPVVGGNVSLYNETAGDDIDPTPIVGVLGLVDRLDRPPPGVGWREGDRIMLLGPSEVSLAGSRWAFERGARGGSLAPVDLALHERVAALVRRLVDEGTLHGVHDVSDGGLAVALAEMAVRSGVGFNVARIADHRALFGEGPSRVVIAVSGERLVDVEQAAAEADVSVTRLGVATGDRLRIKDLIDVPLAGTIDAWRTCLPSALGQGTINE